MNDTLSSTRSSPALLCVAAIGAILLGLAAMSSLPASLLPEEEGRGKAKHSPLGESQRDNGDTIVFGVEDDTRQLVGVPSPQGIEEGVV